MSGGFELRLIILFPLLCLQFFTCFHNSLFFGLHNTVSLRSHYCAWGRAIKRPRTRSAAARQVSNAHERDLVMNLTFSLGPFQVKRTFLKVFFRSSVVRAAVIIPADVSIVHIHTQTKTHTHTVVDVVLRRRNGNCVFLTCCPGIINYCLNSCRLKTFTSETSKRAAIVRAGIGTRKRQTKMWEKTSKNPNNLWGKCHF